MQDKFIKSVTQNFKGESLILGAAILNEPMQSLQVKLALKMLNRHGLISGATGTGKTKTVQVLTEKLSEQGVPSLVMDIKGDLSGLSQPGKDHPKIQERAGYIGLDWQPRCFAVEFLSLSKQPGVKLRSTISEFGPMLFAKMLGLNENQTSLLAVIFQYADDNDLALTDLKDFKTLLKFVTGDGKQGFKESYGSIASNSVGAILRKVIELEQQGAKKFFAEPSFEIEDLLQVSDGEGAVNIMRLNDLQEKPKIFSTFMLSLLAELYQKLPEEGDLEKPKLVIFIDEAHLIFKQASRELLEQLDMIVKLIRSKGVGIFFCTQNPNDIPAEILGQLGTKIQHALRAFTAKDRKAIKLSAENFPESEFYSIKELITSMGIGEALVSSLDEKGRPTPVVHTLIAPPQSRMDTITKTELLQSVNMSDLVDKYIEEVDKESAHEILSEKLVQAKKLAEKEARLEKKSKKKRSNRMSFAELMVRRAGSTIVNRLVRGVMGKLFN